MVTPSNKDLVGTKLFTQSLEQQMTRLLDFRVQMYERKINDIFRAVGNG